MCKTSAFSIALWALAASLIASNFANARQRDSAAARPPLVYERSSGGPGFAAHERLTLKPDGSVVYETSGPVDFEWSTQNRVGEFAAQVDAAIYSKLTGELTRGAAGGPHQTSYPLDSGVETITLDPKGASMSRATGAPSVVFDALVKEIGRLKATTLPHPFRTLELFCNKQPDTLACQVRSVGSSPAVAPDLYTTRFFCYDRERHMQFVAPPAGVSESKGQRLELAQGQAIDFRLPASACQNHLVIDATGKVFVSNPLGP